MGQRMNWESLHVTLQAACQQPGDEGVAEPAVAAAEIAAAEGPFECEVSQRDAREEGGGAALGEYAEETSGTPPATAAAQNARAGAAPELAEMARAAVNRVAASSPLLRAIEDDAAWKVRS